jgi:molybdenum transport protein
MLFRKSQIQEWYEEDVPYGDLTSEILGIGSEEARILFMARDKMIVAGTEIAGETLAHAGVLPQSLLPSGTMVGPDTPILSARGRAAEVHMAWRICLNLLEYSSGIATKASRLVGAAHQVNPRVSVNGTRKHFPGIRHLATEAAKSGGILPHRLGLSESVLIFDHHLIFVGGIKSLAARLGEIKKRLPGKTIVVEMKSGPALEEEALLLARSGVDGIQFDKVQPEKLIGLPERLRSENPRMIFFVAGGIDEDNIGKYASTGVDSIVTSAAYHAPPSDIKTQIVPL